MGESLSSVNAQRKYVCGNHQRFQSVRGRLCSTSADTRVNPAEEQQQFTGNFRLASGNPDAHTRTCVRIDSYRRSSTGRTCRISDICFCKEGTDLLKQVFVINILLFPCQCSFNEPFAKLRYLNTEPVKKYCHQRFKRL